MKIRQNNRSRKESRENLQHLKNPSIAIIIIAEIVDTLQDSYIYYIHFLFV